MSQNPSKYLALFVGLLVFFFTGQSGVQGYVWCLGEDGHTALESAENNSCASAAAKDCHADQGLAHDDLAQEDHCGPCLDISESLEATSSRHQLDKFVDAPLGLPVTFQTLSDPALAKVLTKNLLAKPPPRTSQTLLHHRTVVLLS